MSKEKIKFEKENNELMVENKRLINYESSTKNLIKKYEIKIKN